MLKKVIGHFTTITRHKILVMKECFKIGLYKQGLTHDLSKYSPTEFLVGCKYYQGNRSPNNAEREETGVSKAWLHHKGILDRLQCGKRRQPDDRYADAEKIYRRDDDGSYGGIQDLQRKKL